MTRASEIRQMLQSSLGGKGETERDGDSSSAAVPYKYVTDEMMCEMPSKETQPSHHEYLIDRR